MDELNELLDRWLKNKDIPEAASWFVCDRYGNQVAAVWDDQSPKKTIGQNWSYRSYFHSQQLDTVRKDGDSITYPVGPIEERDHITAPKVSAVFLSKATNTWKVAFSIPLKDDQEAFTGILAVTVEMGKFISLAPEELQYAMLVNGLPGENQGIVLEHPVIRKKLEAIDKDKGEKLPPELTNAKLDFNALMGGAINVDDPMGYDPKNRGDAQQWIAAYVPVVRAPENNPDLTEPQETGLFVVAVEDQDSVLEPSRELGGRMVWLGILALLSFLVVTGGLAYLVFRSFRQTKGQVGRFYGTSATNSSSIHDARTIVSADKTNSS